MSEAGEEGEQRVGGAVAARFDVERSGAFQGSLLDGHVAVQVNPSGGGDVLVAEP
ncbi:MAG: hypothetical protein ACYCST_19880 [Acidimicrobiales bacterium]